MSNEVINPDQQFLDAAGNPLASGTVTFNVNETGTLATIYSDEALTVPQSNPYTLDSSGRISGDVKYTGKLRVISKTVGGATVRTWDNVITMGTSIVSAADLPLTIDGTTTNVSAYLNSIKTWETIASAVAMDDADAQLLVDTAQNVEVRYNNSTSKNGGGTYIVKTVAQAATDGDSIDGFENYAIGASYGLIRKKSAAFRATAAGLNGAGDNSTVLSGAVAASRRVIIDESASFDSAVTIASKFRIDGNSPETKITVPSVSATPFLSIAVGGIVREKSRIEHFDFDGTGTCISVLNTNPIELYDIRFDTGKDALVMEGLFYGVARDIEFQSSGINLDNVNNFEFVGTDARGSDASSRFLATDYAFILNDCDGVSFENMTFEQWDFCRVMSLTNCKTIIFKKVWFESNERDNIIKSAATQNINFSDGCTLELFPSPSSSFITIDNTVIAGPTRDLITLINMKDSYLRLNNSNTVNFKLVEVTVGTAILNMDGMTLRNGAMLVSPDCKVSCRNMTFSTTSGTVDELKFIESIPRAVFNTEHNNWVVGSDSADWDFSLGANFTEVTTAVLTIGVSTTAGEFLTGTKSASITGLPADSTEYIFQRSMSDMGPVSINGETFLIFVRMKTSETIDLQLELEGLFARINMTPVIETKDGEWTDYVFKSASDTTFAQGAAGNPKLRFKVTNASGTIASIFIDRIDYKIVTGDVYLP